jgi:YspA, cpYpsA-related SLOG family
MRVLVCGGRDYSDRDHLFGVLDRKYRERPFSHLIHGSASGADSLADEWASNNHVFRLPFLAEWELHGKAAGPIRNARMLEEGKPDLVIAFPGGKGTSNMIRQALSAGIPVSRT